MQPALRTQMAFADSQDEVEEPRGAGAGACTPAARRQQCAQEGLIGESGLCICQRGDDQVENLVGKRCHQELLREGGKNLLPKKEKRKLLIKSKHAAYEIID